MNASCDKSSGTADQINVSVMMASGEGKLSSPPEYPRVTRLRHRRLMAYHWRQGFPDSYNELVNKTRAVMSLPHLRSLIEVGRWDDAVEYVDRFLPPATRQKSFYADVFRRFLVMLHRFADAAAGKEDKLLPNHYLQLNHQKDVSHADLRLRSICMSVIAVHSVRAPRLLLPADHRHPAAPCTSHCFRWMNLWDDLQMQLFDPSHPLQPHENEGAQFFQPMSGTLTEAKTSGPLRNAGAQFLRSIPGTSTEAKTSGPSTNAGMNKHEEEAGYHTITARQDSDGRNNSRDELAMVEQDRDLKRQRSNEAPGEATLVMPGYCAVEILSAKQSGGETADP